MVVKGNLPVSVWYNQENPLSLASQFCAQNQRGFHSPPVPPHLRINDTQEFSYKMVCRYAELETKSLGKAVWFWVGHLTSLGSRFLAWKRWPYSEWHCWWGKHEVTGINRLKLCKGKDICNINSLTLKMSLTAAIPLLQTRKQHLQEWTQPVSWAGKWRGCDRDPTLPEAAAYRKTIYH